MTRSRKTGPARQGNNVSTTFKIVFSGQLNDDADISNVQSKLSEFLSIPHYIVIKLFDGKAYALVKNLTSIDAVKTESKLKAFGLITKVEPQFPSVIPTEKNTDSKQIILHKASVDSDNLNREKTDSEQHNQQTNSVIKEPISNTVAATNTKNKWLTRTLKTSLYINYIILFILVISSIVIASKLITSNLATKNSSNETIENFSYTRYKQYLNYQSIAPVNNNSDEKIKTDQQQINDYFILFSHSINNYADTVGQLNIEAMGGDKLKQHLQEIDDLGPQFMFWQQLTRLAKNLNDDAPYMSQFEKTDPAQIQWINAIDWISQGYIRQNQDKSQNLTQQAEPLPVALQNNSTLTLNLVLLITLMSFLTLLIILLKGKLRRISYN
ncbi:hypothetical protein I6F65_10745 [Pseudoalteromonas sp. SWXJZ94C]|nr:hypothetical protein [Pseudoalteromonas sp. SWXJZ94C]